MILDCKHYWIRNRIFIHQMIKLSMYLTLLLILFFFEVFKSNFGIFIDGNKNRCIPEFSIYLVKKNVTSLNVGDVVAFKSHKKIEFYNVGSLLGKYIVAQEGDRVEITEKGVFVNDKQIAKTFPLANKIGMKKKEFYKTFL